MPTLAIRRNRLERLLDGHPDRQVILVRGPAGAGKTVLVAQWVSAQDGACVWISIDSTHNDPDRLLRHIVEALERLTPERPARRAGSDPAMLWDLLDQAVQDLPAGIVLVFDDVQRLRDRAAHRLVSQLVERPPVAVRVVLISRSKPRLGMERARLRGDLVEVTPAALRFERAEIDTLAATWTDRHPDAAELEGATLGWAAGLRLAQLQAAADHEPHTAQNEPHGVTSEYIREELFDGDAEALPACADVTCWLPVLTESLRAALADQNDARSPPTWSDLEVLPLLPVASRPGAVRYPPILSDGLRHEYRRRDPLAAATARRRAAEACRQAGELVSSIELFLQAGCADEAAAVCGNLAARGESSLRGVDELLHGRPDVAPDGARWLAWRIRAAVAAGHVDEASQLSEHVADPNMGPGPSTPADTRDLLLAQGALAEHVGSATALLASADRLLAMADDEPADPASARRPQGWRVRALVWSDDLDRARAALRALEPAFEGSTPDAAVDLVLARAWVAWLGGDGSRSAEVLAMARRGNDDSSECAAEVAFLAGCACRERNQTVKALQLLQHAQTLTSQSSHRVLAALAASELARCHRAAGALMDGLELMVSTRTAHPALPAAVDRHVRRTEVLLRLDSGDVAGAQAVLHGASPGADVELLAARIALQQTPDRARALLEKTDAQTPRQAVDKLLLHAQLPDIGQADASADLVAAISAGGHLGLVRTFLDEGPEVSRKLQELALESPDRTLGRLAALVSEELALAPTRDPSQPIEQLTSRELAVLRLLPLRMSNREMAAQLYISVNTLKTHVRAIYRKLGVPHRSGAVRRAKALQLV